MIVLMAGLPGTGKTTLARELALRSSGRVLGKDEIRHALFLPEEIEYSTRQDDFCLQLMLDTAAYLLKNNSKLTVFLDGRTFSRTYQIENVVNRAESLHQSWQIIECVCPEDLAKQRLEQQHGEHPAGNRNFQLYLKVRESFEAITRPKLVIDTSARMETCIQRAMSALLSGDRSPLVP